MASTTLAQEASSSAVEESTDSSAAEVPAQSSAAGSTQAAPSTSALDYLFNKKPQEGSAAKEMMEANKISKSKLIAQEAMGGSLLEDPSMRLRFDKFLALAPVADAQLQAYQTKYDRVLSLLREGKPFDAWKTLHELAEYTYVDAGVSWELANRVESIWNTDKTKMALDKQNQKLAQNAEMAMRNADLISDSVREDEIMYQRKMRYAQGTNANNNKNQNPLPNGGVPQGGEGAGTLPGMPAVDNVMGKLVLTSEYMKTLEAKAKIKMNELKAEKLFDQAKLDFSNYIMTLFESGRYRHVLLAADFYRKIFDEGDYPVEIAQQVNAALEIDREVRGTVDVFQYKLEQNSISSATDRLQEAFMLSEYHPAVLALDRQQKGKVELFTMKLSKMQNMIEARDFTSLEVLLEEMKQVAPDFDTTKPLAIVNAVKLESQLRLGKAKMAAQQGNLEQAMNEFQAAAEAWPGNPDLKDKALTFFNMQDVATQSLDEFDRLVEEENYRAIFDKQLAFAPAMKDDQERQGQLREALEKVKLAETAIEKANLLRNSGDVFGAWETIELVVQDLPDDNKLNALRGDLSGKAAEFVSAINKAKDAEAQGMLGYSLTWYAIAQRYYPPSQIANKAMKNLTDAIMEKQAL
ncbi:MAG: hypothetical protein AAF984_02765 [Verrucomicrobiota bacterium]